MVKHLLYISLLTFLIVGCSEDKAEESEAAEKQKKEETTYEYIPDMYQEQAIEAYVDYGIEEPEVEDWYPAEDQDDVWHMYMGPNFAFKQSFRMLGEFSEGIAAALDEDGWLFVDSTGKEVFRIAYDIRIRHHELAGYDWCDGFSDGLCRVEKDGKVGYIDTSGELVIPCKYADGGDFMHDLGWVAIEEASDDPAYPNLLHGLIGRNGEEVIEPKYERIDNFVNGFARIWHGYEMTWINRFGDLIFPLRRGEAWDFSEGLLFFTPLDEDNDALYEEMYVIDTSGNIVLPGPYGYDGEFFEGKAQTIIDGVCVEIDTKGNVLREMPEWGCPEGC